MSPDKLPPAVVEHILDAASDLIVLHDLEGTIFFANEAVGHFLGGVQGGSVGRSFAEVLTPDLAGLWAEKRPEIALAGSLRFDAQSVRPDGGRADFDVRSKVIRVEGRDFVLSVARDVTDEKALARELQLGRDAVFNMLRDLDASNRELRDLSDSLILAFVNVLEAKSPWTRGHSERVTAIAVEIGRAMGLEPRDLEDLRVAGFLHDIGKVGVFAQILEKPGPLTDIEMELIRLHPAKGVEILAPIGPLEGILPIVRHHHERMDGRGYPDGLAGAAIPLAARILAVADAYDAMISSRPYRPGMGRARAIEEMMRVRGTQLDPEVVDAFLGLPRTAVEAAAFLRRKTGGDVN